MNVSDLPRLAALAVDVAAIDGGVVASVECGECADGSQRSFALVTTHQAGLEQVYRITSPAPAGAPGWARVHSDWLLEVRVGDDSWQELELGLDDDDRIEVAPELGLPELEAVLGMAGWGVPDPEGGDYLTDGCSRPATAVSVAREVLSLIDRGVDGELARTVGAQLAHRLDADVELEVVAAPRFTFEIVSGDGEVAGEAPGANAADALATWNRDVLGGDGELRVPAGRDPELALERGHDVFAAVPTGRPVPAVYDETGRRLVPAAAPTPPSKRPPHELVAEVFERRFAGEPFVAEADYVQPFYNDALMAAELMLEDPDQLALEAASRAAAAIAVLTYGEGILAAHPVEARS